MNNMNVAYITLYITKLGHDTYFQNIITVSKIRKKEANVTGSGSVLIKTKQFLVVWMSEQAHTSFMIS